jgi:hypothetical protein
MSDSKVAYEVLGIESTTGGSQGLFDSKITITIQSTYKNIPVTKIGDSAFSNLKYDLEVIIPNSITSIGNESFYNCGLRSLIIPDSVVSIGYGAFRECSQLKAVQLPQKLPSLVDGYDREPHSGIREQYGVFENCRALASIVIPSSITRIGDYTFSYCTGLESVLMSNGVSSIGERVFLSCRSLTSITLPNTLKSIEDHAFLWCDSLININLPNSLQKIGNEAFSYCNSLTSIIIPKSVTSMGAFVFLWCNNLIEYNCEVEERPLGWEFYWIASWDRDSDSNIFTPGYPPSWATLTWGYNSQS